MAKAYFVHDECYIKDLDSILERVRNSNKETFLENWQKNIAEAVENRESCMSQVDWEDCI